MSSRYCRDLWRAAACVRERLQCRQEKVVHGSARAAEDALTGIERAQQLQRLLHKANQRAFHGAARRLRQRLALQMQHLHRVLEPAVHQLGQPVPALLSMRELISELQAIEQEFDELIIDTSRRTLAVRTEPIRLEGLYLGPFEIRVFLEELADVGVPAPYVVVALDPHPAAGNDHITHPHVSDDRLCTGDATRPIQLALQSGRLCDCFVLVRSVLTTYNSESPYVSIDEWHGEPCADCGVRTNEDSRCFCESCERDYCDQCVGVCHCCDMAACHGCMSSCDLCGEPCCDDCLSACVACGDAACRTCREGARCVSCNEDQENHDEPESKEEQQQATATGATQGPARPAAAAQPSGAEPSPGQPR